MAMTYDKPTLIPRWADTGTKAEPDEAKKDTGWIVDERPPAQWENWKSNLIGSWFKWLDERFEDGATKDELNIPIEVLFSTIGSDLIPSFDAQLDLGSESFAWDQAFVDHIYFNSAPYLFGELTTLTTVNQGPGNEAEVTPQTVLTFNGETLNSEVFVTSTPKQIMVNRPGVYKIDATFVVAEAEVNDMACEFQVWLKTAQQTDYDVNFKLSIGEQKVISCSWIIYIDDANSDYIRLKASHTSVGETFAVYGFSKVAVSTIKLVPAT